MLLTMLRQPPPLFLFSNGKYIDFLIKNDKKHWHTSGKLLWCCCKLGLFNTVLNSHWHGTCLYGNAAMLIAYATKKDIGQARQRLCLIEKHIMFGQLQLPIAENVAAYLPQLALEILDKRLNKIQSYIKRQFFVDEQKLRVLKICILIRTENYKEANNLFRLVCSQKIRDPNIYLLQSNLHADTALQKVIYLNRLYRSYNLLPVELVTNDLPLTIANVRVTCSKDMKQGELVSIIMTAFNSAEYIKSALEGLLEQTWQNIEIIVVDDVSEDATQFIVESYAKKDQRIKYIRLVKNVGTFAAKTIGLNYASGEYITCHDSDDWSHPQRIERQIQPLLKNKNMVATTSNWVRLDSHGVYYARQLFPLVRLNPASPLFRRKLVEKYAGLWHLVRTGADSEFIERLKLVFGNHLIKKVREPLALGLHRSDSLMNSPLTGYTNGISTERAEYYHAWREWHISCLSEGRSPKMLSLEQQQGVVDVPSNIEVSYSDVCYNYNKVLT